MKRILSFAASAAMLLGSVSCEQQPVPGEIPMGGGNCLKTITVDLGDPATRAASALSGEGAIEDATLFVWQHNAKTDETTLYQKAYAEVSTFEFSLLFSDQTEYTYSINAWANMGELDSEPADGEILFSNEEATGLQMKGSKSGIDQASASAVTVDMKRFVGKITVAEVALEWTNEQNALQDFTLKSIYVANAGDKAEGATAAYNNVSGAYASSAMDAMLYSPVNSVIADGASYSTAQMMYAYGSGSTAIVLECDLGGQAMYYHVPYEPEWNTHRAFSFTIRQAGADRPLGELPEEAIEVNVTTLNVLDWDADEQEQEFGTDPYAPVYDSEGNFVEWARIQHVDGTLYTAEEWLAAEAAGTVTDADANGVAVKYSKWASCPHVIHPNYSTTKMIWSSNTSVTLSGVHTTTSYNTLDRTSCNNDVDGKANTDAILAAVTAGTIADAPAAQWASQVVFADGSQGYLPAGGEVSAWASNKTAINACMDAIGGNQVGVSTWFYTWTSTQYSSSYGWIWYYDYSGVRTDYDKTNDCYVRAVCAFAI